MLPRTVVPGKCAPWSSRGISTAPPRQPRPACAPASASDAGGAPPATVAHPTTRAAVAGDSVVPPPPSLHGKGARKSWNSLALAFLGDGVWEMYVRRRFFYPPVRMSDYYAAVVRNVRAEAQATAYASLLEGGFLSAEERDVLRWGRNATGTTPKRMDGGAMRKETYRAATAVETLTGYLYLTDPARLHALMAHLGLEPTGPEGPGAGGGGAGAGGGSAGGGGAGSAPTDS